MRATRMLARGRNAFACEHLDGDGVEVDKVKAAQLYPVDAGDTNALYWLRLSFGLRAAT